MAFVPINGVGQVGVIRDIQSHLLPVNVWSHGENVRMRNGSAEKFHGHAGVFGTPTVAPYQLFFTRGVAADYWIYAGLTKVYVWNGSTHTDLTRAAGGDYAADANFGWNGGVLSGIPVLNNGVDTPQMWNPVDLGQKLQELSNWPASTTVKVLRPYGNFLVGLDWTESGTRYPYKVRWSHPADPGAVPSSWNVADATKDTGEFDLGQTSDYLIDCLPLRSVNVIYKAQSAYTMQFVGGQFIFNIIEISQMDGIFSRDCAVEFRPGQHAVLTPNDFIIHNTVTAESAIDKANRDWLFKSIDGTNAEKTFLTHDRRFNEVWICFPETGETFCTHALVWNYRDRTWGHRELPDVTAVDYGPVTTLLPGDTWDSGETAAWNDTAYLEWWDQEDLRSPEEYLPVMASPGNTKMYQLNATYEHDGTAFTSTLERVGLPVSGLNRNGSATLNFESFKTLRSVRPRFSVMPTTTMRLYVGTQLWPEDEITWSGALSLTPEDDFKVDHIATGRLFSFRIEDLGTTSQWKLDGYDLDISVTSLW